MTAAYTCPRCVNLIAYGIPHACKVGVDASPAVRPDGKGAYSSYSARPTVPASTPHAPCACTSHCGDDGDTEGPGICKRLPRAPEPPLVEIVLVPRRSTPHILAPGGTAQPADVPPDRRTEGAVTPEAGAKTVRWGALPAGEETT